MSEPSKRDAAVGVVLSTPTRCRTCDRADGSVMVVGGRPKQRCLECADVTEVRCPACRGPLHAQRWDVSSAHCPRCQRTIRLRVDEPEAEPPAPLPFEILAPPPSPPPPAPDPPKLSEPVSAWSGIEVRKSALSSYRGPQAGTLLVRRTPRTFRLRDPWLDSLAGSVKQQVWVIAAVMLPLLFIVTCISIAQGAPKKAAGFLTPQLLALAFMYGVPVLRRRRAAKLSAGRKLHGEDRLAISERELQRGDEERLPVSNVARVFVEKLAGVHRVRVDLDDGGSQVLLDGLGELDAQRVEAMVERAVAKKRRVESTS